MCLYAFNKKLLKMVNRMIKGGWNEQALKASDLISQNWHLSESNMFFSCKTKFNLPGMTHTYIHIFGAHMLDMACQNYLPTFLKTVENKCGHFVVTFSLLSLPTSLLSLSLIRSLSLSLSLCLCLSLSIYLFFVLISMSIIINTL